MRRHFAFFVFSFSFFVAVRFLFSTVASFRLNLRDLDEVVFDHVLVAGRAGLLGSVEELLLHEGREVGPVAGADADFFDRIGAGVVAGEGGDGDALLAIGGGGGRGGLGLCGLGEGGVVGGALS